MTLYTIFNINYKSTKMENTLQTSQRGKGSNKRWSKKEDNAFILAIKNNKTIQAAIKALNTKRTKGACEQHYIKILKAKIEKMNNNDFKKLENKPTLSTLDNIKQSIDKLTFKEKVELYQYINS